MDKKLILLFSLLLVVVTLFSSIYAYNYNMALLHENTYTILSALGKKMLSQVEASLQLMDYAIEALTSTSGFMNAMRQVSEFDGEENGINLLEIQQQMYQCLYQEPLIESFYRVSVFSSNGFYLSNHFEKTGSVTSMSPQAREIINGLDYLEQANSSPSTSHIIGPHPDPWSTSSDPPSVFSCIKAVNWHGIHIGYIEVASSIDELIRIFSAEDIEGLTAHVLFDNGTQLFRFYGDDASYPDATDSDIMLHTLPDGSKRFVIRQHSKSLGLNVYVAQDINTYHARSQKLLREHLAVSSVILILGIVIIILISRGLTKSMRNLTHKLKHISSRSIVDADTKLPLDMVTRPHDREFYEMEQILNDLLVRLRHSAQHRVSLQNTTLQAQLNALQTQINPHFIYNTLNIISAKGMESGNEEIMNICDLFAQMLRYSTDISSRSASLRDEVRNAENYLLLTKARYEDQLEFHIDMPDNAEDLRIPKLTLQPLIENAITHGFKKDVDCRRIRLSGEVIDDTLRIIIRDNGNGFKPDILGRLNAAFTEVDKNPTPYNDSADGRIGLINTYRRLHYYSRGQIRMAIYNDEGAVVELNLPL